MKIKKSDIVLVISGKDRGKQGKVLRVFSQKKEEKSLSSSNIQKGIKAKKRRKSSLYFSKGQGSRAMVEGVNLRKKHKKPKKSGEKGQVVSFFGPIFSSNLKLICSKCGKATRVGYKIEGKKKLRICKKCGQET